MRVHRRPWLFVVIVLTLAAAPPLAAQTGTIAGRVMDAETGVAVSGVRVEAIASDGIVAASAATASDGSYRLTDVPVGTYTVTATLIGYGAGEASGVRVSAGETTTAPALELTPEAFALNPVVVSVSKRQEKALEAPARVEVIGTQEIQDRPATSVVDHLRTAPAVDIIAQGMSTYNVSARGFNSLFSGALNVLVDNRIASLPSLRNNSYSLIQTSNEDIARMEVVLGPGSALYGPNTANGVLHIITQSPLDEPSTTVTVGGGERDVFQTSVRTSQRVSDDFGIKVSGLYTQGHEWEHRDPAEEAARAAVLPSDPDTRIGLRDFDTERWTLDARADWRLTDDATAIFAAGLASATGIELHGVGASQVVDWKNGYYQARVNSGRLFAQAYLNFTDSGEDTYQLRSGLPTLDESKMLVGQVQHGLALGDRQDFTYGIDYLRTMPDTKGTLHGANEDDDVVGQLGAYIQSETSLHPKLDLVIAGRYDEHTEIEDAVFSPRAALVFTPIENHSFRATYNRAFSTPRTQNFFHDFDVGLAPSTLGQLGFRQHLQGNRNGFSFQDGSGNYLMRSPFNPGGASQAIPVNSGLMYQAALGVLAETGAITGAQAGALAALTPLTGDLGVLTWDLNTDAFAPLGSQSFEVPSLDISTNETFEVGYQTMLSDRVRLAADVWYSRIQDFISRPRLRSPLLVLNPEDLTQLFVTAAGMPQAQAEELAAGMAQVPTGVLTSPSLNAVGADLLVTYVNYGEVNLWGTDVSADVLLNDRWTLGINGSIASDDRFENERRSGEIIPLNGPEHKVAGRLAYRSPESGLNGEVRARYTSGFPAATGVHLADRCISSSTESEPCIDAYTIFDLTLGYRLPQIEGMALQLSVTNLFDTAYRSFAGVPEIGRLAFMQLRYEM